MCIEFTVESVLCLERFFFKYSGFSPSLKTNTSDNTTNLIWKASPIKGAVSRKSSSFCLILPITCPQSLWNLK